MEKSIQNRLLKIIDIKYDGNKAKFCRAVKTNKGTFSTMLSRKTQPSFDLVANTLIEHDDISPDWLILGKGEMLRSNEVPNGESDSRQEVIGLRKEIEYLKESNGQLKEINHLLKRQLEDLTSSSE